VGELAEMQLADVGRGRKLKSMVKCDFRLGKLNLHEKHLKETIEESRCSSRQKASSDWRSSMATDAG